MPHFLISNKNRQFYLLNVSLWKYILWDNVQELYDQNLENIIIRVPQGRLINWNHALIQIDCIEECIHRVGAP